MKERSVTYRGWEYKQKGDYHRNLDPNWSYTPTYVRKLSYVAHFIASLPRESTILDVGCGEGVLVEELANQGFHIRGLDLNYESDLVRRGDARSMPYDNASVDVVLFLDTLEHLPYEGQPKALTEIHRVLRPGGYLLMSAPNLAHLNSRVRFLLRGRLDRTDVETNHVGERPIWEYEELLLNAGFRVLRRVGVTFTAPILYRGIICRQPARFRWLHALLEPFARVLPSLAMVVIFVCGKAQGARQLA